MLWNVEVFIQEKAIQMIYLQLPNVSLVGFHVGRLLLLYFLATEIISDAHNSIKSEPRTCRYVPIIIPDIQGC